MLESPETRASIHKQGLTGNESRCVAAEKRDRGSDLTRMSEPLHRHFCEIAALAFAALGIVRAKQYRLKWRKRRAFASNGLGTLKQSSA